MKLNKKECRKYADPGPAISPDHGLLHAPQVNYIVRAAVKTIDHHRVLVLYVYSRQQAAQGDYRPLWTMFQGKDDYITLARNPDGTTKWRTAVFEKLDSDYFFVDKCAFYSAKDQERASRYFNSDSPGFTSLVRAQNRLLERRWEKRLRERDRKVRAKMKNLPALPRDLGDWLRREVLPAYFLYSHAKGGEATGVCTACGQEASLTGAKHNAKGVCPHCGRELTMKPRGRIGKLQDRETCQVVQRTRSGELVVRIIKVIASVTEIKIWENARQFVSVGPDGRAQRDSYYDACDSERPHWKKGERPVFYPYSSNFYAETCGHVYCWNLQKSLAGTPWQYCPIQSFYEHFHEPMLIFPFLAAHLRHPKLEHLVKVGFYHLASDMVYRGPYNAVLDETQNRTHRLLGVGAEDVDFLRNLDVDVNILKIFRDYCQRNLKDRQKLLAWQLEHQVSYNVDTIVAYMTAHKLMRYLDNQYAFLQFRLTQFKAQRYRSMQDLVTEYRDYLDMCEKQNYDMTNSFVLYPKDLQKAHDKLAHRIQMKADAKVRRDFRTAYQRIMGQLDFELDGMKIIYPATPDDIVAEGHALHHCVGGYVDRVAQQKCMILFLRRCEDITKPFYTVEVCHQKAVQVRGMQNADMTPEVKRFMEHWERQVLRHQDLEAAA